MLTLCSLIVRVINGSSLIGTYCCLLTLTSARAICFIVALHEWWGGSGADDGAVTVSWHVLEAVSFFVLFRERNDAWWEQKSTNACLSVQFLQSFPSEDQSPWAPVMMNPDSQISFVSVQVNDVRWTLTERPHEDNTLQIFNWGKRV